MMFRYAQIDEEGRVFTVGEHSAELKHERAIPVPQGFDHGANAGTGQAGRTANRSRFRCSRIKRRRIWIT